MSHTPHRRHDDPQNAVDPDEVERFFASLPTVVRRLRRGRIQNLAVALFTFVALIVLAFFYERQADEIRDAARDDRRSAFQTCRLVNDNARQFNELIDQIIFATRASRTLTDDEKEARVAQYEAAKQQLPVCRRP